ncbi:MAG: MFS transporter [Deltaproteobacteria bacterium]|nr:MFS transporter [Deltaproteobacteria bacterium]
MDTNDAAAREATDLLIGIISNREAQILRRKEHVFVNLSGALLRNMIGGIIGNVLEWFDFAVFGFFAPVIGEQFFPSNDPLDSLLSAFSVFAAAYLMRPIGGIIFGHIGDSLGRKKALQLSVMMMALPTCLMGLLPTHAQIGVFAPVLLVLLRMIQGLSVGGELIGSIAFVAETAPPEQRGYFSSWTFASCYGGILLGSFSAFVLNAALGAEAMADWGWRLPFLAGILIGLAGLWMRSELTETPVFEQMKKEGKYGEHPLAEAMSQVPGRIFHASALIVLVGGGFYLLFVWWPTLLSRFIHPHVPYAMALNTFSMLLLITLIPITGRLSDEWGRKPLLVMGAFGMTLLSLPLFLLVAQSSFVLVLFSQLCFTVLMSLFLGPIPATLVELFPARLRYSAIGIGYNISMCLFGGSAPLVATWLVRRYHSIFAPAIYLTFLSVISLLAAMNLPEREAKRRHL